MRIQGPRFKVISLLGVVFLTALGLLGFREWDKRNGRGATSWHEARRWAGLAAADVREAQDIRDCPRAHTPWQVRYVCPACIPCPRTPLPAAVGEKPIYLPDFEANSDLGRGLQRRFMERHAEVVSEYLAEAALCHRLSQLYFDQAAQPTAPRLNLTSQEQQLQFGNTLSSKYRMDSY